MLNEIDDQWLMEFKSYLTEEVKDKGKRRLKANTAHSYFNKIRSALTHSFDRNLLEKNPANLVSGIRAEGTKREFLTLEEVKKLADTPCEEMFLKEAFLFSVLTGLRWADIFNLTWEEVKEMKLTGGTFNSSKRKRRNTLCCRSPFRRKNY